MNNELIKIRCDLHQIPELGRREYKTKEYILSYVKDFNCKIFEVTPTGVALFFNANKKETICFRSDMDALPIKEESNVSYKSLNEGIMHACGHDGHMAMLLLFSKYASNNLDKLKYNIVCLFQPSEEDMAGSLDIINTKILDKLNVCKIFGFHIWPTLEENKIFTMPGGLLATSAEVNISILGKECHAANRDLGIDALYAGTSFINKVYEEINEKVKSRHLISFGKMISGSVRNAVAKDCHIEATLRAFDDETFNMMCNILKNVSLNIDLKFKTKTNLEINALYKSVLNDEALINQYKDLLKLNILDKPFLQAEDFGNYTRLYPSMFMLVGCGNKHLLHTSTFDFNMDILELGYNTYIKIATNK